MKFDKYKLASAVGIALVIIVIIVFTQRSDWDANKYILSADNEGNLEPKSEKYFDDKEKALLASVDAKIAAVNNRISGVDNKVNVQRTDFNNYKGAADRHFSTKAEFNRLDAWHRGLGAWTDARYQRKGNYQPAGNYVQYGRPFHLQNQSKGNDRFGAWNERGGWYGGPNQWTQWVIT